ncbi:MAG: chloride channel protein [Oscillospiraceae bacterium]|nr:chloride channel protein [Oscillospiraceae bacterium]
MDLFLNNLRRYAALWRLYVKGLGKWLVISGITGLLCGVLGSAFHVGVEQATQLRLSHPWILYTLPAAGLLVVAIYKFTGTEGQSTNNVIDEVQSGRGISLALLPAIFFSTIVTHLAGGSAGREGAALQMGGAIGFTTGRLLHLDDRDLRTATLTGMAAFFSALFGTPLAATIFAMAVISVGLLYHAAFIPCFVASLTAYGISLLLGVAPTRFAVLAPELSAVMLLRVAVLAALCAAVSVLFCSALHGAEHILQRRLRSPWLRAFCGGALLLVLSLLVRTGDYNGAGMGVIARAVEEGQAAPPAFLLKILFTAVTLGSGFKGGEVVPSFFVGAAFGCVVGPLLGIPAGFAAAVGLVAVFCGAVNCPIASIFLSVELFGAGGMLYYALACGLSYVLSGYSGIYSSQRILYDKLKAQYIDVHTNAHTEGQHTEMEQKYL